MLTIVGNALPRACDGLTRRTFLRVGATGLAGLSLPELLCHEARANGPARRRHKAFILVESFGGGGHHDTIDHKPDAPDNCRGPYGNIATNVPGMRVGQFMTRMARIADKWAGIRTICDQGNGHEKSYVYTGMSNPQRAFGGQGAPAVGAVLAKLFPNADGFPAYFASTVTTRNLVDNYRSYLGPAFDTPANDSVAGLNIGSVPATRLQRRRDLLSGIDQIRRDIDQSGLMETMDAYSHNALNLITSGKLAEALDVTREDPRVLAGYGGFRMPNQSGYVPAFGENPVHEMVRARRLIEAGARCVAVRLPVYWDTHDNYVQFVEPNVTATDCLISGLIGDLEARGMLDDVMVLVWTEVGTPPYIAANGSRAHWQHNSPAIIAGGGLRTGQYIGATDHVGGQIRDRPVRRAEVLATVYRHMGIDVATTTIRDSSGRPNPLLLSQYQQPLRELI